MLFYLPESFFTQKLFIFKSLNITGILCDCCIILILHRTEGCTKILFQILYQQEKDETKVILVHTDKHSKDSIQEQSVLNFIRLYPKPMEECLENTSFPKHKFQELLMRLSYSGVLPNVNKGDYKATHLML